MESERTRLKRSLSTQRHMVVLVISLCLLPAAFAAAVEPLLDGRRNVLIELYHDDNNDRTQRADAILSKLVAARGGIVVVRRNVREGKNKTRHAAIVKHYRLPASELPLVYGCDNVVPLQDNTKAFQAECEKLLQMTVYIRRGCKRCDRAKEFLNTFGKRYPAIRVVYRDLVSDRGAVTEVNRLVVKHRKRAVSVPAFYVCNQLLVGFDRAETTGRRLDDLLSRWTAPHKVTPSGDQTTRSTDGSSALAFRRSITWADALLSSILYMPETSPEADEPSGDYLPLPTDSQDIELELAIPTEFGDGSSMEPKVTDGQHTVQLPWFGEFDVGKYGLVAFTMAIGLVDGFNPCAMWVLMFLLSLLVNLRQRSRILAVAGTFVVVSGLAYFAFMVAWLNVFMLIGFLRPVQIALGVLGITIGAIHIKDFFAFKYGFSLSIPEAAKPTIYSRTRAIVTAENLTGAIVGATILAVLVNMVELLCTAGLPALYTEVLASYELPVWKNYAYVGLYILVYMIDDALMVAVVVATLSKRKLQEGEGRWLKLLSGVVILVLGLVVLVQPEWMQG